MFESLIWAFKIDEDPDFSKETHILALKAWK